MSLLNIVLFATFFATGYAGVVQSSSCGGAEDACTIGDVRIDPCERGKSTCVFRKGTNVSLGFDFTPSFATSNLKTMVYWDSGTGELEYEDFGSDDACAYTSCPSVPGQAQSLSYNLYLATKLPKGKYPLKWKVWNGDNQNQSCCFKISIRLLKQMSK